MESEPKPEIDGERCSTSYIMELPQEVSSAYMQLDVFIELFCI